MVENVEHFDAELRADPLGYAKVLEDREVHVEQPWSDDLVSTQVSDEVRAVGLTCRSRDSRVPEYLRS